MAKKYITDKISAKTASSGITYEGDAVFRGGPDGTFSFDFNSNTTNEFSVNLSGDDFLTVNGGTGVFEVGDIAGLFDGLYLKVDGSNNLLSWKASQDTLVTFGENSTVSLYGTGTNNASGAELHIIKGQSNEVTGKLKLNSTNGYLDLEYGDPGATNSFRLYQDYGYISSPLRIGANASANEFDDYEEGTYTPGVFGYFGGLTNVSFTTQLGKYIKIGPVVHCFFEIVFTGSPATNNILGLNGLPFLPSNDGNAYGGGSIGVAYKNRWNFVYTAGGGADSLLGVRKLGTASTLFFNMDDGNATNSMRVDALTGDTSNVMSIVAHITYRTTS